MTEAEPLYPAGPADSGKGLGPGPPHVATCLENYAALLRQMGREKRSGPLEERARAIRAKQQPENPPAEKK